MLKLSSTIYLFQSGVSSYKHYELAWYCKDKKVLDSFRKISQRANKKILTENILLLTYIFCHLHPISVQLLIVHYIGWQDTHIFMCPYTVNIPRHLYYSRITLYKCSDTSIHAQYSGTETDPRLTKNREGSRYWGKGRVEGRILPATCKLYSGTTNSVGCYLRDLR